MNPFVGLPTIAAALAGLSIVACSERHKKEGVSGNPSEVTASSESLTAKEEPPSSGESTSLQQEIEELQRSIQMREQTIEDLNAAVLMEEAKLDENPDYDSPILYDVLQEQEQERLKIETAQERLEALTR